MFQIGVRRHFDAAHFLINYDGPCAQLHGHRWEIEVIVQFAALAGDGMAIDFKAVKAAVDRMLPDHSCLNELYDFNPTAENLAEYFYQSLDIAENWDIVSVTIWESPDCWAKYDESELHNS